LLAKRILLAVRKEKGKAEGKSDGESPPIPEEGPDAATPQRVWRRRGQRSGYTIIRGSRFSTSRAPMNAREGWVCLEDAPSVVTTPIWL
jgi:hypothetical protein